jgi:ribosomal protein S6
MKTLGVISIYNSAKQKKEGFFGSGNKDKLKLLKVTLNRSFEQIQEQFEDHLEAINENTNEIHSNFEYLCEMDCKIDKLAEKIDELNQFIREQRGEKVEKRKFEPRPLTKKEKEVFYALYVLTEGRRFTTYKEISRRACFSEELVASYVTSLIEKGIPVVKRYANRKAYIALDPEFREIQARENIVGVNTLLTHWVR